MLSKCACDFSAGWGGGLLAVGKQAVNWTEQRKSNEFHGNLAELLAQASSATMTFCC